MTNKTLTNKCMNEYQKQIKQEEKILQKKADKAKKDYLKGK